jgi:hypothetical protein
MYVRFVMFADEYATVQFAVAMGSARATYVAHREPGEWFVGGAGFIDDDEEDFSRLTLGELLQIAPYLEATLSLPVGQHAFWTEGDRSWTPAKLPSGETYLVTYEVRPTEMNADATGVGGAFANCWVVADSLSMAEAAAVQHLEETGWGIIKAMATEIETADDLDEDTASYFRQSQIEGLVCVLHTFPPEELDHN